jgi:hypothetical protein
LPLEGPLGGFERPGIGGGSVGVAGARVGALIFENMGVAWAVGGTGCGREKREP